MNCYNSNIAKRFGRMGREDMLNDRQIRIMKLLYSQETFITMMQIAQQTGVSQKTVRNDIAAIRELCQEYNIGDVLAKPHEGVMIKYQKEEWEEFLRMHDEEVKDDDVRTDIKCLVIRLLLKRKSVNFGELERNLYAGRSTIEKELPDVRLWFQSHNILFEKKRGRGMEIYYSEYHYRMAMWSFLGYWSRMQKSGDKRGCMEKKGLGIVARLLDGFDSAYVERSIGELEQKYGLSFSYEAHQQLLFLISLMISRIRKRYLIEPQEVRVCRIDSSYDERLTTALTDALEKSYQICIPKQEKNFLSFLIHISDIQGFSGWDRQVEFENENLELCYITMKLANLLGEIINIDLKSDAAFAESLMLQLRTTIQRLRYHVIWKHPLLRKVKQKYPNIFAAVYAAGVFFDRELGMEINEHEMCCLALHLGGALERNISILTACVVCNYGIGVSQLLRERIERNITDLKIQGVFSVRDMKKIRAAQCDLIISTLSLEEYHLSREVVVVEHLLPACDMKKIEEKMKQLRRGKLRTKSVLGGVHLQKELFNREFVWLGEESAGKQELISRMCRSLIDAGYVTEEFEASVFEHEEKAPTYLGMGVAIPHGFAKHVIRPVVAFASLRKPIAWEGEEKADMIFLLAFNLDEASGLKEETIKFYSVFLDLLDHEEDLRKVRNITEISALVEYMNQKVRGDKNL